MQQGICNPEFYGVLEYKFKKIIGNPNFSNLFKRIERRVLTSSSPDIGAGLDYVLTGLDSVSHW